MIWIPILLFFTIMEIQSGLQHDQPTCRNCAKNKRLYISQYIDIVFSYSGPLGILDSVRNQLPLKPMLGGVKIVELSISSLKQTQ